MQVLRIASRECGILIKNPIYLFCMVLFPITVLMFFVSMMENGQPVDMPVGVVDLDNTSTTHALVRKLDSFQSSHVVGHLCHHERRPPGHPAQ
jgi:ABC-2 type transport system permease protein